MKKFLTLLLIFNSNIYCMDNPNTKLQDIKRNLENLENLEKTKENKMSSAFVNDVIGYYIKIEKIALKITQIFNEYYAPDHKNYNYANNLEIKLNAIRKIGEKLLEIVKNEKDNEEEKIEQILTINVASNFIGANNNNNKVECNNYPFYHKVFNVQKNLSYPIEIFKFYTDNKEQILNFVLFAINSWLVGMETLIEEKIKSKTISSENDNTNLSLLKDNMNEYYNISKIYIEKIETFIKNNGLEKEYPIEILKRINNGRELYLKSTKETRNYVKNMIFGVCTIIGIGGLWWFDIINTSK